MKRNNKHIPINNLTDNPQVGILVKRRKFQKDLPDDSEHIAHRHDEHLFLVIESGEIQLELDFQQYTLRQNTVAYIHPSQVHRILDLQHSSFAIIGISSVHIKDEYFNILEQLFLPAKPIFVSGEHAKILSGTVELCESIYNSTVDRAYSSLLSDYLNAFIGLYVSQYLRNVQSSEKSNRYQIVTKAFRELLEKHFSNMKKPGEYANILNISPSYLRECVRIATGMSVTDHIQNRIILEAKRLLCHSKKTIKEIAIYLGYDDHSYFSRLFKKAVGITAHEFRNENHLF